MGSSLILAGLGMAAVGFAGRHAIRAMPQVPVVLQIYVYEVPRQFADFVTLLNKSLVWMVNSVHEIKKMADFGRINKILPIQTGKLTPVCRLKYVHTGTIYFFSLSLISGYRFVGLPAAPHDQTFFVREDTI